MGQGEGDLDSCEGQCVEKERLNSEYILDIQQIRLSDGLTPMQVGSCSGVS